MGRAAVCAWTRETNFPRCCVRHLGRASVSSPPLPRPLSSLLCPRLSLSPCPLPLTPLINTISPLPTPFSSSSTTQLLSDIVASLSPALSLPPAHATARKPSAPSPGPRRAPFISLLPYAAAPMLCFGVPRMPLLFNYDASPLLLLPLYPILLCLSLSLSSLSLHLQGY
ncbi:hypothetical protein FKP32DRAFT_1325325 [Trametes sanguinea]|nr:hypothetical protein FKP32DRAFT_1325325 [Trametes sanguinea]